MSEFNKKYQVIIVGGGPVGLFLGCCLYHRGYSCLILEKQEETFLHSRSIGIHPVSLELFHRLDPDLASNLVNQGIQIQKGVAVADGEKLGEISFVQCPLPYNFVLSLPQYRTEKLLHEKLNHLTSDVLFKPAEFISYNENTSSVTVHFKYREKIHSVEADFMVGCDGKESLVRRKAKISFNGSSYPDTYVMGDFSDNTNFGTDAIIFLAKDGLVESFPLNGNYRRWVIKTDQFKDNITRTDMEQLLQQRIGIDLSGERQTMMSSFGVHNYIAETFVRGRVFLAGDAAHVISPIGGQGMNLGWIDAWELGEFFDQYYSNKNSDHHEPGRMYSQRLQKTARTVARRAGFFTILGRKTRIPPLRNVMIRLMLNTSLKFRMAQIFTMRRLGLGLRDDFENTEQQVIA